MTFLIVMAAAKGVIPITPGLLLALTWAHPQLALPVLLAGAVVTRRSARSASDFELVSFYRVIASELRAGQSLRLALAAGCGSAPGLGLQCVARMAVAGRSLDEVARDLSKDVRLRSAAVALRVAGWTGGSVVGIFDALTAEAVDEEDLRREQRSLTVQARLSVAVVGGFPLVVLAWQVASGEMRRVVELGPIGVVMVTVGVSLLLSGLTSVLFMMNKARQ